MPLRSLSVLAAFILAACSTGTPASAQAPAAPQAAAETTVQQFLQAVADSNLVKMAELWGTSKGSAARTRSPENYEQRVLVMQAYLRSAQYRILSNEQDGPRAEQRILQVEFTRNGCENIVPVTVVRTEQGGWVIRSLDLAQLGSPARKCDGSAAPTPG